MLLRGDSRPQLNVHFEANLMLDGINLTDKKCTNRHIRTFCQEITTPSAKLLCFSTYMFICLCGEKKKEKKKKLVATCQETEGEVEMG